MLQQVSFALKSVSSPLGQLLWAFRYLFRQHRGAMLTLLAIAGVDSGLPATIALATRTLVNQVTSGLESGSTQFTTPVFTIILLLLLFVVQSLCNSLRSHFGLHFRDEVHLVLACDVMERASRQNLAFFEAPANQDLLARINQSSALHISNSFLNGTTLLASLVKLLSLFAVIAYIEPLICLLVIPLFLPYLHYKIRLAHNRYAIQQNQATRRRWSGYFVNLLTNPRNMAEIKLLGMTKHFTTSFQDLMTGFFQEERRLRRLTMRGDLIFSTLANLSIFGLLLRVVNRVVSGALTIGDLVVFIGTAANLRVLLENVSRGIGSAVEQASYINHFRGFLHITAHQPAASPLPPEPAKGGDGVVLEEVCFSYPGQATRALDRVSLTIQPGETVALIGANGSGKTTLAKLIAGLYTPDSGTIRIGGQDLRQLAPETIQATVSFVLQNFGKYEASTRDNIAIGDWQRLKTDREGVEEVARRVGIDATIRQFPQGYDTKLGRLFGTHEPSGGQWQYLAIARAIAKPSTILLLDEPSASLDIHAESKLFNKFKELAAGRTTILISHRLSSLKIADRIVVFANGSVAEVGSHEELLAKNGAYASMYHLYLEQMRERPDGP